MPITFTPVALPIGSPLSVTDPVLVAGTHTDACEPTGTWTVSAKLFPERVQAQASTDIF